MEGETENISSQFNDSPYNRADTKIKADNLVNFNQISTCIV